ncbi:helix-turn-helix domain-containing protein [Saccharolobus islandicus]|uniref:Putative DNA binding protein n=1 Tax=Saccharolobus islandicus LAL14/1 TaxID=1241935 RepID=M9U5B8_SACIS|nr:helix-turn-helix domain-containing protein [Sulfolobus islandicus]AGJ62204.1 putative DNA binding protein [Sulfolobus islandicus LAL14/1]
MINLIKHVDIVVSHEDCWTSHMPFTAYTINLEVYPHKNYLRSRILIDSMENNVISNLMKTHRSVIKVMKVDRFKGGTYVDFLNKYKGSIAGVLYDKEVLILGNLIEGKDEKWSFVTSSKNLREILTEIESLGKVKRVETTDFNPILYPNLTEWEKKVLTVSYSYGYLDYPRRATADELAELLGISKVTFLYHLRNAQRKLIAFFIKNILA